jgi:hypothetical protein
MKIALFKRATALLLLALSLACATAQSTSASAKCTAGEDLTATLVHVHCQQQAAYDLCLATSMHKPEKSIAVGAACSCSSNIKLSACGRCMSRVTGCQPAALISWLITLVT